MCSSYKIQAARNQGLLWDPQCSVIPIGKDSFDLFYLKHFKIVYALRVCVHTHSCVGAYVCTQVHMLTGGKADIWGFPQLPSLYLLR